MRWKIRELIETYWNVNCLIEIEHHISCKELIETYWNVNSKTLAYLK